MYGFLRNLRGGFDLFIYLFSEELGTEGKHMLAAGTLEVSFLEWVMVRGH